MFPTSATRQLIESTSAAETFIDTLNAMKQELRSHFLQFPLWGEQIVYEKEVGDVVIRNVFLRDARLRVVFDPVEGKYRMIVLRRDHSASVCYERKSNRDSAKDNDKVWLKHRYSPARLSWEHGR